MCVAGSVTRTTGDKVLLANREKVLLRVLAGDWWSARELALFKMAANAEHVTDHEIRPCTLNSTQPTLVLFGTEQPLNFTLVYATDEVRM